MEKGKGSLLTAVLVALGVLLIAVSAADILLPGTFAKKAEARAQGIASELLTLMPDVRDAVLDDRVDTAMAVIEVDGEDFAGIIEIPVYSVKLPIYAAWDRSKVADFPCRYSGSIYEGCLVIGGSDNEGQLDFMKLITGNDAVYITDASGLRYTYTVTDIWKTRDVSTEALTSREADLVIFARNTYSLDYTVVCCKLK